MIMKIAIEPNKTDTSLIKLFRVIVGTFIALYTMAIATVTGRSHNIDCGFVPISSGVVKLAITKSASVVILASSRI